MGKFFSKFPSIDYNGQVAKNLLVRPKISDKVSKSGSSYYNYLLPEESRADIVSFDYYGNPDYAWLIYLANNVVDPYHDLYISETDFNLYIIKKYGSLQYANQTIHSWVLNWGVDDRRLSPVQYEALPGNHKKYWSPEVKSAFSSPSSYVRMRAETMLGTNRIAILIIEGHTLNVGDEYEGETDEEQPFIGVVKAISGDTVSLHHVVGPIEGDAYSLLPDYLVDVSNIPADEFTYWTPLTVYDMEAAANAAKRNIQLINKQIAFQVEKDLKKVLSK